MASKNFRQRQYMREQGVDGVDSVHPHSNSHVQENEAHGAGTKHLWNYDEHGQEIVRGREWAEHGETSGYNGAFKHTNGLHPDVHQMVGPFARSVNMSGGVNTPGYYTSDCAPGTVRANIDQFTRKYRVFGEDAASGSKNFPERQRDR